MICFKANELVGGIGTDVLGIFPNAQTKPVKTACRRIQYYYNKNIDIHCADENLTAYIVQHLFKMYNYPYASYLVDTFLYK